PQDGKFGLLELRDYPESDVISVSASGLGGGSLIYANVLMPMPAEFFQGWPGGITREVLDPYYARVLEMLEASPYPHASDPYYADTPKTTLFQKAAATIRPAPDALEPPTFCYPHLAVRFQGDFPGQQTRNRQGVWQSRCIKCGECDIGCNIHAKNTLDLTYLARARRQELLGPQGIAAEIRTEALVHEIRPLAEGGYAVVYGNPRQAGDRQTVRAQKVVLAAGSVGSTGLLLRMQRQRILTNLSPMLGKRWCANGDLEGTVLGTREEVIPTKGPVITGAIVYRFPDYPDGFPHGLVIQDAGIPAFLAWFVAAKLPSPAESWRALKLGWRFLKSFLYRLLPLGAQKRELNIGNRFSEMIDNDDYIRHTFLLLGMGRDRSTGRIELREDGEPVIRWNLEQSRLHYERVRQEMEKLARALGGTFLDNPLTYLRKIIAVHPLGGCVMADSPEQGVVNPQGEVFGHPGLYVVDGSIIPTSIGPNPSLTIAALAEYIAERLG
ncbi:MAG: GMC family oxidoreductase, partial [Nitrospinota bacterium]